MSETESVTLSHPTKLFEALAKAQGQIKAAQKTSENPAFSRGAKKSTYADIAEVIEVIQKPASENGLSVIFNFKGDPSSMEIRYTLMHSSGEHLHSEWIPMFLREKTLHAFGASNTFMRRQLLKAIYQIPEEDDDGNSQSQGADAKPKAEAPKQQYTPKPQTPPTPATKPAVQAADKEDDLDDFLHSPIDELPQDNIPSDDPSPADLLRTELYQLVDHLSIPAEKVKEVINHYAHGKRSTELNEDQLRSVITHLKISKK